MHGKLATLLQRAKDALETAPWTVQGFLDSIIPQTGPYMLDRARAHEIGAELAIVQGDIPRASELAQAASTIYARHRNKRGLARTCHLEGRVLSLKGYRHSAATLYDRALSLSHDPLTCARIKVSRAITFFRQIEPVEAFQDLLLSVEVIENEGTVLDRLTAIATTASLLDQLGDPSAEQWLSHIHAEATLHGLQLFQLRVLNMRGAFYARHEQFDEAASFFRAAVELAEKIGYQNYYIFAQSNLIQMHLDNGDRLAATQNVRCLECVAPNVHSPFMLCVLLRSVGAFYGVPKTIERSIRLLEYALTLIPEDDIAQLSVLSALAKSYAVKGDRSKELSTRKRLEEGKDRLYNFPTFNQVAGIATQIAEILDVTLDGTNTQPGALERQFIQRLVTRNPGLTPMELKICNFLRQQFTTKAIALELNISPRTVEDHRFRIRKRLDLPNSANLTSYLASL